MKYLQRPSAPKCLEKYDYNTHVWGSRHPSNKGRIAIWEALGQMQGGFCCYCESIAVKGDGHIEHFFHKGKKSDGTAPYKQLTFDWNNLFGCCGFQSGDTCGHYKDSRGSSGPGPYNPQDLIKPDIDDPADYFKFLPTGKITVKSGLSQQNTNRAEETIRVLNLSALNGARKRQIDIFKLEILAAIKLAENDQQLIQERQIIRKKIKNHEFQTAVLDAVL